MITEIKEILSENLHQKIISVEPLSGGDINFVYKCILDNQTVVIKINDKDLYPEMFEKEKLGLELLAESTFLIPKVISVGQKNKKSYIIWNILVKKPLNWDYLKKLAYIK